MAYCPICGDLGVLLDGSPCKCKDSIDNLFEDTVCLEIPEQYQGIIFNKDLVPADCGGAYQEFMQRTYNDILALSMCHKNLCICSPSGHSKTILAYSATQGLFRKRVKTAPILDVLEARALLQVIDAGKESNTSLLDAPFAFIKIPLETDFQLFATIAMLLDRRVRRGNSTIFLYNGTWEQMTYCDNRGIMNSLLGDGAFCTIENRTWRTT